ncbi:hypothetical protein KKB55_08540 [Myxococcota bacterium]|nr:hypothetical protein [Myxococcota bacterium]MBU1897788.1 hypothetical protein [Myxococcota bacterium]
MHSTRGAKRPALYVIYFGIGFTLAAALSMTLLSFLRPLMAEAALGLRVAAMLAPLILGALFGLRVAILGGREGLTLGRALRRALRRAQLGPR